MVKYYESFAETHKGHGTDFAIIAGILGLAADDSKVPDAIKIAESKELTLPLLNNWVIVLLVIQIRQMYMQRMKVEVLE